MVAHAWDPSSQQEDCCEVTTSLELAIKLKLGLGNDASESQKATFLKDLINNTRLKRFYSELKLMFCP